MGFFTILLFQRNPRSWNDIFSVFFDLSNPIYISILVVVIIYFFIYFTFKHIIFPEQKKHQTEKENLELKAAQLMALFSELDPDPIIRIDSNGLILITNESARNVFRLHNLSDLNIDTLLNINSVDISRLIEQNESFTITKFINRKYYSILLRGNSDLNIAQLYFRDITERKQAEKKLRASQSRLKDLSDHLQKYIEAERQRISQALHDGIGQNLSLLRLNLHNMKYDDNCECESFQTDKKDLIKLLDSTITELKDISYGLRPKLLEEMGLQFALEHLVTKVASDMKIKGSINISSIRKRLNPKLEIIMFRIAQEAINNILKHSKATEFNFQFAVENKFIRMIITDNGIGFDPDIQKYGNEKTKRMGLLNIEQRIASLNGIFKIESSEGRGTMLVIEIPNREREWQKKKRLK